MLGPVITAGLEGECWGLSGGVIACWGGCDMVVHAHTA